MIIKSIAATFSIGIGCLIYINHPSPIGAFFFSIGLLTVFILNLNLFTGKIGFVRNKRDIVNVTIILIINLLSSFIFLIYPSVDFDFTNKLLNPWYLVIFKGFICGILIYLSVRKKPLTLIAVPAFILCGAEHCIADMIYLVLTRSFTLSSFVFIGEVILGNTLGSLFTAYLDNK